MPESTELVRWTILYSGTVQGVGFRYTAEHLARRCPVTGYVRNLRDGRVEVVAEGAPADLRTFDAAIEEAMSGYISDRQVTEDPATGEFRGFSIRF